MPAKKSAATQPPAIDFVSPDASRLSAIAAEELVSGDYHEGVLFTDADLTEYDLAGSSFLECRFDSVTLTDTELRGSRVIETVFEASFAHTLKAARTTWRDVRVQSPRWGSAELFDSELESVHIRGGKIDYLNLRGSRMSNVLIEDCFIADLDLGGCTADRVAFVNCRVGTLDVTRASLTNVDLRTSEFQMLNGIAGLAGATIDDLQLSLFAPVFAQHLGLRVD